MAANNGGGRQGNNQMNEHVEFSVKAEEDLYLTGAENTIRRVTAETNYSCLMLKTQRFSSLFRHYAKYHGLRKDDLEYYFVNLLENEDTPESVQLQRGDTIMVRKRRKPELPEPAADDDEFFKDMRDLLEDEEHMDAVFLVHRPRSAPAVAAAAAAPGAAAVAMDIDPVSSSSSAFKKNATSSSSALSPQVGAAASGDGGDNSSANVADRENMIEVHAHKCILTARGEYFKALFRTGASVSGNGNKKQKAQQQSGTSFKESEECVIRVEPHFTENHIRLLLEFVYTNRIQTLRSISTDDLLCMLHLADKWLLRDLKRLVEHQLIRDHMSIDTVAKMYGATEDFHAQRLSRACIEFIMSNLRQLAGNTTFEEEMKNYPHLCIPVLKAAADLIPDGPVHKKQRTSAAGGGGGGSDHHGSGNAGSSGTPASAGAAGGGGGLGSSPVPDSDT